MVEYQITIVAYDQFEISLFRETTVRQVIGSEQSKRRAEQVAVNSFKQRHGVKLVTFTGVVLGMDETVKLRGRTGR